MANRNGIKKASVILASAAAGLMAVAGVAGTAAAGSGDKVHCYGVNKCKGTGACGGKGHSCAGENKCKGQGFLEVDEDTCLKIEGGRLTPSAKK